MDRLRDAWIKIQSVWGRIRGKVFFGLPVWFGGLIIGFAITMILSNAIAGVVVHTQIAGHDPVPTPEIEPTVAQQNVSYKPGQSIRGFDELQWQNGYELYSVVVQNPDTRTVRNVRSTIQFPGCIVGYRKQRLGDRISLRTKEDAYVVQGNASIRITHCDQEIWISEIHPDETASLAIVVKRFGTGFPSQVTDSMIYDQKISPNATFKFDWWYKEYRETSPARTKVQNSKQSYTDAYLTFSNVAMDKNQTARAGYYMDQAYQIAPDNPEVVLKYGYVNVKYGYEQGDVGRMKHGKELIIQGINMNTSDPWGWYYRAVAESLLAVKIDDSFETQKHYCLAQASLTQAKNDGELIPPAEDLKMKLDKYNPSVECNIDVRNSPNAGK